jgi:hypothetical protein
LVEWGSVVNRACSLIRAYNSQGIRPTLRQVLSYNLLPNPTKKADPRAKEYVARYGDQCWELDALEPTELQRIVREAVEAEIDPQVWREVIERNKETQRKAREELKKKLDSCP